MTPESPLRIPGLIRILHENDSLLGHDLSLPLAGSLRRLMQIAEPWWEMKPCKEHLSEPPNHKSPGRRHPNAHALPPGNILGVREFQGCRKHTSWTGKQRRRGELRNKTYNLQKAVSESCAMAPNFWSLLIASHLEQFPPGTHLHMEMCNAFYSFSFLS